MTLPRLSLFGILLVGIGLLYVWVGIASQGVDRVLGLAGGALIIASALASRRRVVSAGLLLAGALPLAAATWWSIVTPALAVVALLLAIPTLRQPARPRR